MHKRTAVLFSVLAVSSFLSLLGCDQIQKVLMQTKTSVGSAASTGSSSETPVQGTVLARVNSDVITLEDFDQKLNALKELSPDIKIDDKFKKDYLNDLITQDLIFQEAKARGIEKQKDVRQAIDEFRKGVMARQLVLDETKGIVVDRAEVESFYNQYRLDLATAQELHVKEMVLPSEQAAKDVLIALLQGEDFGNLARQRSIAVSSANGGDLGWINVTKIRTGEEKAEKFPKFYEVISTLDSGQVSQIFNGPDGVYLVKVEEKKGGEIPSLSDVFDKIKDGLVQQKQMQRIKDLTDQLKANAKIEIKEELLTK